MSIVIDLTPLVERAVRRERLTPADVAVLDDPANYRSVLKCVDRAIDAVDARISTNVERTQRTDADERVKGIWTAADHVAYLAEQTEWRGRNLRWRRFLEQYRDEVHDKTVRMVIDAVQRHRQATIVDDSIAPSLADLTLWGLVDRLT